MGPVETLLSVSAKLHQHLSEMPQNADERDTYIDRINELLNDRGHVINHIETTNPNMIKGHQLEQHLIELDKGIREQLQKVMNLVKADMKQIQDTKKSEQQYMNPYAEVRVMDGMYYDRKK